jgi:O-antigen/teichoic acid export membrane protein
MNIFAQLVRNSLWLLLARIIAQFCTVLATYLLVRYLSVAEFGEYSFMAAAILVGNTLTTFGSDMVLIREVAVNSKLTRLSPALFLQLALSFLFIILVFWRVPYLPNQTTASILALKVYSFALIPLAFFTVFTSILRGYQKMEWYAWLNLLLAVLLVLMIFILMKRGSSIVTLAYGLLSVQILGTLAAGFICAIHFPDFWKSWRFSFGEVLQLVSTCLPIALIAILGIVYQKLSLTMLSLLDSASIVGWFSASTRVLEAARMGHVAAFTALYPAMANARHNPTSKGIFKYSLLLLLIIAMVEAAFLFLLAQPFIIFFFGPKYQVAVSMLRILALTLIPYTVNSYLSLAFLVEHREKTLIWILFVSLLTLLFSNLWMVPRFGGVGASWSFLLAESVQAGLLWVERIKNHSFYTKVIIPKPGASHELSDLS